MKYKIYLVFENKMVDELIVEGDTEWEIAKAAVNEKIKRGAIDAWPERIEDCEEI